MSEKQILKNMKNQKQQTTVDWIEQEMLKGNLSMKEILEQAKEMEKERMIDFGAKCLQSQNETYGGNK